MMDFSFLFGFVVLFGFKDFIALSKWKCICVLANLVVGQLFGLPSCFEMMNVGWLENETDNHFSPVECSSLRVFWMAVTLKYGGPFTMHTYVRIPCIHYADFILLVHTLKYGHVYTYILLIIFPVQTGW